MIHANGSNGLTGLNGLTHCHLHLVVFFVSTLNHGCFAKEDSSIRWRCSTLLQRLHHVGQGWTTALVSIQKPIHNDAHSTTFVVLAADHRALL